MWLCLAVLAVFLSGVMGVASSVAMRSGKSGLIDATWSFAVGLAAIAAALWPLFDTDVLARRLLVASMAAVWSARLGIYIARRSHSGGDDPRYAALKQEWGASAARQLFLFLQIQAVAGWPLVGAALLAAHNPVPHVRVLDVLGALVFLAGVAGESLADSQMGAFRANPANRGRICDAGLWSWSRHPNYFFEWVCWLAYALIAADFSGAWPWGWLAFAAPATMYVLLVRVSGIPPLEAHLEKSRAQAFAEYKRRVSAFWPLPPRSREATPASRKADM